MAKKIAKPVVTKVESILGVSAEKATALLATLTEREHEVASLMASGEKNKNIAAKLGISTKTLDIHRANLKWKLKTRGPVDVARVVYAKAFGEYVK
jgi:two-component system response regulator FixJ